MYFPGDPLFPADPIFNSVRDPKARERMISTFDWETTTPEWALGFRFDVVLDGPDATPMEEPMLDPTPAQTVGPYFAFGLCRRTANELVPPGRTGAIELTGRVLDGAGDPLPDALVEIWQADADGVYRGDFGWGRCGTDADGEFRFVTVKPGRVPGPTGTLQAPHLTMLVFARGLLKAAQTRVYFADEAEANAEDPVLTGIGDEAARASLIAMQADGSFRFDVHLQGDRQTAFFAL